MPLKLEPYAAQRVRWPASGRHILAQFDQESVVVYQAYRPSIARFALEHGRFGGDFRLGRMSWVKPNFLWMMFRSGWGTKPDQEVVLAVHLDREFFEELLAAAVPSSFDEARYPSREAWQQAVAGSDVRLQWDPDHGPRGEPLERRAVQLGLRGETLRRYAQDCARAIEDCTELVAAGRAALESGASLVVPHERVYTPADPEVAAQLGLEASPE